jgi:hypothetical protein
MQAQEYMIWHTSKMSSSLRNHKLGSYYTVCEHSGLPELYTHTTWRFEKSRVWRWECGWLMFEWRHTWGLYKAWIKWAQSRRGRSRSQFMMCFQPGRRPRPWPGVAMSKASGRRHWWALRRYLSSDDVNAKVEGVCTRRSPRGELLDMHQPGLPGWEPSTCPEPSNR